MAKKAKPPSKAAIAIIGAGPIGRITALLLNAAGADVVLVGHAPKQDERTTALMQGSLALLDQLGLVDPLATDSGKLRTMRIIDGTKRLVRARPVSFYASEIEQDYFGLNVPNNHLNALLAEAITKAEIPHIDALASGFDHKSSHITITLDNGAEIEAHLVIGADGRLSAVREAASISVKPKALPQSALVLSFTHERPHQDISTEFHTEFGPFTQVPLPDKGKSHRSSLVWVTEPKQADALMALDDAALALAIEQRMQSLLGKVTVTSQKQIYPLHMSLPSAAARNRFALVGEAAHAMPPIGAQGMNLSLRDCAELTKLVAKADDPGRTDILDRYSRNRKLDIIARIGAVGALNNSLLSDMLPAQMARAGGLGLMAASGPLRGFFMREGMQPGTGFRKILSLARRK